MAVEVKPPITKSVTEVHIEKLGQKSRKWRDLFSGFLSFLMLALMGLQLFLVGYHVALHNYAQAGTDGLLALMFTMFWVFTLMDMNLDAKFGREAMRAMKDTGEVFGLMGEMLAELDSKVKEAENAKKTPKKQTKK